jgi:hypothetical protein
MNDLAQRVRLGVTRGLVIGGAYVAASLVVVILRGPSVLEQFRMSVAALIAYDLLGGALTGAIVGVLLPLAERSGLGAAVVGFVSMFPVCLIGTLIVSPPEKWHEVIPAAPLVSAALLGGLGGPALRSQYRGEFLTSLI